MKEITINDRGIFVTETRQIKTMSILQMRRKLEREIIRTRQHLQDLDLKKEKLKRLLINLEEQLERLRSSLVEGYIEKERREREEIQNKAQSMLRELVGEQLFQELQVRNKIIFEAKDHIIYKIEKNGRIYRKVENSETHKKEWQQLCIIRPRQLPLPDFLISLFISVREHPNSYRLRRR